MKKKHLNNTSENRNITIFKAPEWTLQLFSSIKKLIPVLLLTFFSVFLVMQAETAFSKRPLEISFGTEQTLNIFPTAVTTTDWAGIENVLIQDLTDTALYQDFGARTAAYIAQEELIIPSAPETSEVPIVTDGVAPAADSNSVVPTPAVDDTETSEPDSLVPSDASVTAEETPEVPESVPEPEQSVEPTSEPEQPAEPESDAPATELPSEPVSFNTLPVSVVLKEAWGMFPLAQLSVVTSTVPTTEEVTESHSADASFVVEPTPAAETPIVEVSPELESPAPLTSTEVEEDATSSEEMTVDVPPAESENVAPEVSSENVVTAAASSEVHEITLSNFATAPLERGQFINGMRLTLSLAAQLEKPASGTIPYLEVLYGDAETREVVGII